MDVTCIENTAVFTCPETRPSSLESFDVALQRAFHCFDENSFVMHYDLRSLAQWFSLTDAALIWRAAKILSKHKAKTREHVRHIEIKASPKVIQLIKGAIRFVEKVYTIRKPICYIES